MITYIMKCRECGHTKELKQSIKDDLPTECEKCGGKLGQQFGTKNETLFFEDPRRGAISRRYL